MPLYMAENKWVTGVKYHPTYRGPMSLHVQLYSRGPTLVALITSILGSRIAEFSHVRKVGDRLRDTGKFGTRNFLEFNKNPAKNWGIFPRLLEDDDDDDGQSILDVNVPSKRKP